MDAVMFISENKAILARKGTLFPSLLPNVQSFFKSNAYTEKDVTLKTSNKNSVINDAKAINDILTKGYHTVSRSSAFPK